MERTAKWILLAGLAFSFSPPAHAQLFTLAISIQTDASGISLGGSGTSAATMAFGSAQAFGGSVASGVTKTTSATDFTLSTPFDVKVTCILINLLPCLGLNSPNYMLTAQLQSADAVDTWKIAGSTLSSASATTITAAGAYGSVVAYTFALTIPFSKAPGALSNTINFIAISN